MKKLKLKENITLDTRIHHKDSVVEVEDKLADSLIGRKLASEHQEEEAPKTPEKTEVGEEMGKKKK